jgi:hypothetical protein
MTEPTKMCTAHGKGIKSPVPSYVIYERFLWISIECKKVGVHCIFDCLSTNNEMKIR